MGIQKRSFRKARFDASLTISNTVAVNVMGAEDVIVLPDLLNLSSQTDGRNGYRPTQSRMGPDVITPAIIYATGHMGAFSPKRLVSTRLVKESGNGYGSCIANDTRESQPGLIMAGEDYTHRVSLLVTHQTRLRKQGRVVLRVG